MAIRTLHITSEDLSVMSEHFAQKSLRAAEDLSVMSEHLAQQSIRAISIR